MTNNKQQQTTTSDKQWPTTNSKQGQTNNRKFAIKCLLINSLLPSVYLHITSFCVWNCSLFHLSAASMFFAGLAGYIIISYRTNTWWYQNPRTLILKIPLSTSLTASWNMPLKMPFSIGPFESCWLTSSGSSGLGSRSLAFSLTSALTWTNKTKMG